jgi:ADP-heptose:LPS heptosyltransferase
MRVETMRAVDRWLGRPAAWALTRWRRLAGDAAPRPPNDVRKVLFVKLSEMGALVLATPAFAEARRVFGNAETWIVCFDENSEIAAVAGGFPPERIVAVRAGGVFGTIAGLLSAIRRLRRERFDVIVDLEYFSRVSTILAFLAKGRVRAGFHRFEAEGLYCGDLYTHRASWNPYLHVAQLYVVLVRAAAADPRAEPLLKEPPPRLAELSFPRFTPGASDVAAVRATLSSAGVPDGAAILLVNPNSSDLLPLRRWPEQHFVALCRLLVERRPDAWVVLTGARHEAALADRIVAALRAPGGAARCVSLVGRTDLRQLLTLFSMARVLVSADSGPPHFAAMTPIRGVTLFGPETPSLYGPVNERNVALTAGLACSPCIHAWNRRVSTCTDNRCMQLLAPEAAADAALRAASA